MEIFVYFCGRRPKNCSFSLLFPPPPIVFVRELPPPKPRASRGPKVQPIAPRLRKKKCAAHLWCPPGNPPPFSGAHKPWGPPLGGTSSTPFGPHSPQQGPHFPRGFLAHPPVFRAPDFMGPALFPIPGISPNSRDSLVFFHATGPPPERRGPPNLHFQTTKGTRLPSP